MALGALEAIKAAGKLDEILVVGIDALPEACAAVKNGEMAATVFQDAAGQGIGAVEMAVKAAKGETIPKEYMIPYKLVTKENVDEYSE
jgi:inositol transport system substrate-binding protein